MAQKVITLTGTVELPQVPFNQTQELLVMASLQAPQYEQNPDDKRAPVDICCVIDKSGSMAGAKLELAKEALHFVVKNLEAADTLSVVVYDTDVSTLFDFIAMDKAGKAIAEDKINRIAPGSSTNLCGGLVRGLELQGARKNAHDISSVLILTDGLANHGITETAAITAEMEKHLGVAAKRSTVFTFGFGADHNQEMLRSIAEAGGGMYYFVENADYIPKSFADCLGGLQSIVAQNILLAVEGLDGTRIVKSLNSKFKLAQGTLPGNRIQLEIGDIYSEEERDLVFLVELPQLPAPRPEARPVVSFALTYFNVLNSEDHSAEEAVSIARPASVSDNLRANVALDKQRNRLEAADAMEKARKLANEGQLAQAQDLIRERKDKILKSESANETFCEKLVKELDQCIDDMKSREHYRLEGAKKMARKEQSHQYQRSNRIVDSEEAFYETSSKMHMKSGFH